MPVNVSPLVHIEIVVPDAERAYQILHNVFGAQKVQELLANFLDSPFGKVIHVALGNVVLQFVQPNPDAAAWEAQADQNGFRIKNLTFFVDDLGEVASWHEQLRKKGPGVHNLTFIVDNIREAVDLLEQEGVSDRFSFQLDWQKLLGPENVKPNPAPAYMVKSMDRIGFNLELVESPTDNVDLSRIG